MQAIGIPLALNNGKGHWTGGAMSAYLDSLMIHGWHRMQTWRFASGRRDARSRKQRERATPSPAIHFPCLGVSFAGHLGLDLGIDTDPALGAHRHL